MRYVFGLLFVLLLGIGVWLVLSTPDQPVEQTATTTTTTTTQSTSTPLRWATYKNDRFGYKIRYPDYLTAVSQSQNNDGRIFSEAETNTELEVFANNNAANKTLRDIISQETAQLSSLTNASIGSTTATISGSVSDGRNRQTKILFADKVAIVRITYPASRGLPASQILSSFTWGTSSDSDANQ